MFEKIHLYLKELKEPNYRYSQVKDAILISKIDNFNDMSGLPVSLRTKLQLKFEDIVKSSVATETKVGATNKVLFKLTDNEKIEAVELNYEG